MSKNLAVRRQQTFRNSISTSRCTRCRVKEEEEEEPTAASEDEEGRMSFPRLLQALTRERTTNLLVHTKTFIPQVILNAMHNGTLPNNPEAGVEVYRCTGCVVFSDASGFTALTEQLAKKANGAEILSKCLNKFFTPLIDIITAYRGDVIKFSGDALTILFDASDDGEHYASACGTPSCMHSPLELCIFRACACCLEIHKRLHNFHTGEGDVRLTLHIGVGAGEVLMMQVGGVYGRYEYVIAGSPLEQISIAEPLAVSGETVLSPEAWMHVEKYVIEGAPILERPEFHRLWGLDNTKHTFPTVKNAAQQTAPAPIILREYEVHTFLALCRRFIPHPVMANLECGTFANMNEMRSVTIIFVQVQGVDVSTTEGSVIAQALMKGIQIATYREEGNLNKFLVDDKGLLFLLVYGLPPLVHVDDPVRAVRSCKGMQKLLSSLKLQGRFGVTTGRVFCGVVGSASRREYTTMGDTVNLSARLMANAKADSVLVDKATYERAKDTIFFEKLDPIKVKGKQNMIEIFAPVFDGNVEALTIKSTNVKLDFAGGKNIRIPWRARSTLFGGRSRLVQLKAWAPYQELQEAFCGASGLGAKGGVLMITGASANGKEDLCESTLNLAIQARMVPLCTTLHDDYSRPLQHMLESGLSMSLPSDGDVMTNSITWRSEPFLKALQDQVGKLDKKELLWLQSLGYEVPMHDAELLDQLPDAEMTEETAINLVCRMTQKMLARYPMIVCLRWRRGTSIFVLDQSAFWRIVNRFAEIARRKSNRHPLVLLVICREFKPDDPTFNLRMPFTTIEARPLNPRVTVEYAKFCLDLPKEAILPVNFFEFLQAVSLNVPLYIQEILDQLRHEGVIEVLDGQLHIAEGVNLDDIAISEWVHTIMVGQMSARLESIDPIKNSVLKMTSCCDGPCSSVDYFAITRQKPKSGLTGQQASFARCYDQARTLAACQWLEKMNFLRAVPDDEEGAQNDGAGVNIPRWAVANGLIRKIAKSMVLHCHRLLIKRSVLIQRALAKELPARLRANQEMLYQIHGETTSAALQKKKTTQRYRRTTLVWAEKLPSRIVFKKEELFKSPACSVDLEEHNARVQIPTEDGIPRRSEQIVVEEDDADPKEESCEHLEAQAWTRECVIACCKGDVRRFKDALRVHPDSKQLVGFRDASGFSVLHFACYSGNLEVCKMLLKLRCEPDVESVDGVFPLTVSALYGNCSVIYYLIERENSLELNPEFRDLGYWEAILPDITDADDVLPPMRPIFTDEDPEEVLRKAKEMRKKMRQWFAQRLLLSHNMAKEEIVATERVAFKMIPHKQRIYISLWTQFRRRLCGKERRRTHEIARGRPVTAILTIGVFLALFLPDILALLEVSTDVALEVSFTLILICCISEWFALLLVDIRYMWSFFFWVDLVNAISLIVDISQLFRLPAEKPRLITEMGHLDTRFSPVAARATRMARLVKAVRYLPGLRPTGDAGSAVVSMISTRLTLILSTRVALLTITLTIIIPLISLLNYPSDDLSLRFHAENLARIGTRGPLFTDEVNSMKSLYAVLDYGPFEFSLNGVRESISSEKFSKPNRPSFHTQVTYGAVTVSFDMTRPNQYDAIMSIALLLAALFIMSTASLLLSNAVNKLSVRPLERMLDSVRNVAETVFQSVKNIESMQSQKSESDSEELEASAGSEVALLEKVVERLASMAELQILSASANTIDASAIKTEDMGVFEIVGRTVGSSGEASRKHLAKMQGRLNQRKHSVNLDGNDYLNEEAQWSYDFLALNNDDERVKIAAKIILYNPSTAQWIENHIDPLTMQAFLVDVHKGYEAKPSYHCFTHGCDVMHVVFYYFLHVKAEMFLSSLEQFTLLVAAICHDIGHFAVNNPFLIETGHKLAILYNDQSPLENMHCARLFEIVKTPKSNIFSSLSREKYKEVRTLCIAVILHTDMIHHFPLIKSLSMIYEMNAATFDATRLDTTKLQVFQPSVEELQIFMEDDTKKEICNLFLHSADVSNPCKPWDICHEWSIKVLEELFNQGDIEKKLRIPVGILNDRNKVNTAKSQIGFMEFIVAPLVQAEVKLFPQLHFKRDCLNFNLGRWEMLWISDSKPRQKEQAETRERIKNVQGKLNAACSRIYRGDRQSKQRGSNVGMPTL
eukprot:GEMP01000395.1.p1 GENE.GEMP01000395.1~~GEMP01000395.1.p1  ORF type:complete len:2128 (+),score=348.42 GEMP01000395.1:152-6535(+)